MRRGGGPSAEQAASGSLMASNVRRLLLAVLAYATLDLARSVVFDARAPSLGRPPPSMRSHCVLKAAKKSSTKKRSASSSKGGGFGSKSPTPVGPTPAELLKQSMALYEEFEKESGKSRAAEAEAEYGEKEEGAEDEAADAASAEEAGDSMTKYAVTVRVAGSKEFSDWVPVAILAVKCGADVQPGNLVADAIGSCCKLVCEAGCQSYPALRKLDRASTEYAYENLDSFQTHVYEGLFGRSERRAKAAGVLGVEPDASAAEVKKAHRKLMLELHPDRFVGDDDGAAAAEARMLDVQDAYAEMGGGQGRSSGSWYAAVGGKARVDFSGPLDKATLGALGKERLGQSMSLELGGWRAAVFPFEPSLSQEFITRNIARASSQ